MNVSQYANEAKNKDSTSASSSSSSTQQQDDSHQNPLKRIWDKLTHHENNQDRDGKSS